MGQASPPQEASVPWSGSSCPPGGGGPGASSQRRRLEPTGALDYVTGKQVLKVLQDMCEQQNMTVVMITHNSALAEMGQKIIRVKSGQIEDIYINQNRKSIEEIEY